MNNFLCKRKVIEMQKPEPDHTSCQLCRNWLKGSKILPLIAKRSRRQRCRGIKVSVWQVHKVVARGGVYKSASVGILFVTQASIFAEIVHVSKLSPDQCHSEHWFRYILEMGLGGDRGQKEEDELERKHSSRQAVICRKISGVSLKGTPVLNFAWDHVHALMCWL